MGQSTANKRFSVVVPLYNKQNEIEAALRSIAGQSVAPFEVIVVDDGSTDFGPQLVEKFKMPNLRLLRQPNRGVAAARNRGIEAASGEWIALLDADDRWYPDFLAEIGSLIDDYPDCGIYSTAFEILTRGSATTSNSPARRGVVDNFWQSALHHRICNSSNSVLPRTVLNSRGFPEGMRIGEDQYMWIKAASAFGSARRPRFVAAVVASASNRSVKIYTPEQTTHSFEALRPNGDVCATNLSARCAIGKAITLTVKGDTAFGRAAERNFGYTRLCDGRCGGSGFSTACRAGAQCSPQPLHLSGLGSCPPWRINFWLSLPFLLHI